MTDEQIDELITEHSEWTPQGYAIIDSHRYKFARAILAASASQSGEPVAWMYSSSRGVDLCRMRWSDDMKALGPADMVETPLYGSGDKA